MSNIGRKSTEEFQNKTTKEDPTRASNSNSLDSESRRKFLGGLGGITIASVAATTIGLPALNKSASAKTTAAAIQLSVLQFFEAQDAIMKQAKRESVTELIARRGPDAVEEAMRSETEIGTALTSAVNQFGNNIAEEFTFVDQYGRIMDKATYLKRMKSGYYSFEEYTRSERDIRVFGDRIVMTSRVSFRGSLGGREITAGYRETHTLQARETSLVLLASQSNVIQARNPLFRQMSDCGEADTKQPVP